MSAEDSSRRPASSAAPASADDDARAGATTAAAPAPPAETAALPFPPDSPPGQSSDENSGHAKTGDKKSRHEQAGHEITNHDESGHREPGAPQNPVPSHDPSPKSGSSKPRPSAPVRPARDARASGPASNTAPRSAAPGNTATDNATTGDDILAPRRAALDILGAVLDRRLPLDQTLEESTRLSALPARDRAFVRMMVATALRRLGQIDDLIRRATDRKDAPQPPLLHHLLRLGTAQIAFMEVPDYAVVDTAVRLAEERGLPRQKGFVNAVLRRIAREHRAIMDKQDAARLNVPPWLMQIWITDYGLRGAAEIALANLGEAALDITPKDPAQAADWATALDAAITPTGTLRRPAGGAVQELPGFADGAWWVQDMAAALPALLFGDVTDRDVLDLCAAPGGKTAQLAARGARVTALDRSPRRLRRMEENLRRLHLQDRVRLEAADAASWQPRAPVPFVLLDAPCTATGTARRHPDVLHLKTPADLRQLTEIQEKLIDNAIRMLTPGGTLIYCTCSIQKAEGETQTEALLSRHPHMRRAPITAAEIGGLSDLLTPAGDIRILPSHFTDRGGMDGFYIARLTLAP